MKNVVVGGLSIPAGTEFYLAVAAIHHDVEIWGTDAKEFNPARFLEPHNRHLASYLPFGLGSRICIGQNLAVVEAKIILATIIKKFAFVVSPSYVHAPFMSFTVQPQHGAHVLVQRILHED